MKKAAVDYAKSITEAELSFICKADYGMDIDIHKKELQKVIYEQDCILSDSQRYHPCEVISLNTYKLEKGHEREFAICNIIIALSLIAGSTIDYEAEYMLNEKMTMLNELSKEIKELTVNLLLKAAEQE